MPGTTVERRSNDSRATVKAKVRLSESIRLKINIYDHFCDVTKMIEEKIRQCQRIVK